MFEFIQKPWFFTFIAGNITGAIILVFVLSRNPKLMAKLFSMRDDLGDQFKKELQEIKDKIDDLKNKDK